MTTAEIDVLFPSPDAQLRYLRRLEERYNREFMASTPSNFAERRAAVERIDAVLAAFTPESHAARIRERNMSL